ncbi:MAG TPA: recombination mediator RecR [Polyangiaceae bacterium]|nr:recombination mediator RecR [Polyangiaceae bacterium]
MATFGPSVLQRLVQAFTRLPGVGEKTALRFTLHLLGSHKPAMEALSVALAEACARLGPCDRCGNIAELDAADSLAVPICTICADDRRDPAQLCVVARVQDLMAVERSGAMRGRYFVLGRLLSPLDGVGPEELPLAKLQRQIDETDVRELVVATPPSVEGEATALHLAREFGARVRVTRIASGIPHGGDLEFADPITLGRAMAGRRNLDG